MTNGYLMADGRLLSSCCTAHSWSPEDERWSSAPSSIGPELAGCGFVVEFSLQLAFGDKGRA